MCLSTCLRECLHSCLAFRYIFISFALFASLFIYVYFSSPYHPFRIFLTTQGTSTLHLFKYLSFSLFLSLSLPFFLSLSLSLCLNSFLSASSRRFCQATKVFQKYLMALGIIRKVFMYKLMLPVRAESTLDCVIKWSETSYKCRCQFYLPRLSALFCSILLFISLNGISLCIL